MTTDTPGSNEHDSIMWRILLIGGSSCTGKTRLAQRLGREFGVSVLLADDIRIAMQQITTPDQHPDLHFFVTHPDIWDQPGEILRDGWITIAKQVSAALDAVIAHHLAVPTAGPLIIEGDGVLPGLATQVQFDGIEPASPASVRAIFLYQPDEAILLKTMQQRGYDIYTPDQQRNLGHGAWLFGNWLKSEAENSDVPVIPCPPWDTLDARVREIVSA